ARWRWTREGSPRRSAASRSWSSAADEACTAMGDSAMRAMVVRAQGVSTFPGCRRRDLGCLAPRPGVADHSAMSSLRMTFVAAVAGLSTLAPSAARADWSPPAPVTGTGQDAYALGVAANGRDRPTVLFQTRRHGRW